MRSRPVSSIPACRRLSITGDIMTSLSVLLLATAATTGAAPFRAVDRPPVPAIEGAPGARAPGASGPRATTVVPDEPLTLAEAVRLGRERSPFRAAAVAVADGARRAAGLAGRVPNPWLELRSENWIPGGRDAGDPDLDSFAVVTAPIELGGKRAARRAVGAAAQGAADADLSRADREAALTVAEHYVEAVRARDLAILLAQQRTSAADLAQVMRRRVEEGYAPEADLRKFEAELSRVDAQLLRARLALDRAISTLAVLLGEPDTLDSGRLVEPALPTPARGDVALLARGAVDRHPEVLAARARVEQARSQLALERANAVPDLAVSGGYKRTAGTDTGVVALSFPIPLSDRNQPAVTRADADLRAAALELDGVERLARAEVESMLRRAVALQERAVRVERDFLQPAEVVRTAAQAAFREGGGDVLRLVDAERVYLEAGRDALDLKLDAVVACLRVRLALGEEVVP